ncbi:hypothetical protein MBANPS3_011854 [Mucor bainieri]
MIFESTFMTLCIKAKRSWRRSSRHRCQAQGTECLVDEVRQALLQALLQAFSKNKKWSNILPCLTSSHHIPMANKQLKPQVCKSKNTFEGLWSLPKSSCDPWQQRFESNQTDVSLWTARTLKAHAQKRQPSVVLPDLSMGQQESLVGAASVHWKSKIFVNERDSFSMTLSLRKERTYCSCTILDWRILVNMHDLVEGELVIVAGSYMVDQRDNKDDGRSKYTITAQACGDLFESNPKINNNGTVKLGLLGKAFVGCK